MPTFSFSLTVSYTWAYNTLPTFTFASNLIQNRSWTTGITTSLLVSLPLRQLGWPGSLDAGVVQEAGAGRQVLAARGPHVLPRHLSSS